MIKTKKPPRYGEAELEVNAMTRYEKAKTFTVEQMAKWIDDYMVVCPWCNGAAPVVPDTKECAVNCSVCIEKWLNGEAK